MFGGSPFGWFALVSFPRERVGGGKDAGKLAHLAKHCVTMLPCDDVAPGAFERLREQVYALGNRIRRDIGVPARDERRLPVLTRPYASRPVLSFLSISSPVRSAAKPPTHVMRLSRHNERLTFGAVAVTVAATMAEKQRHQRNASFSLRLAPDELETLHRLAARMRVSASDVVRMLVRREAERKARPGRVP